MYHFKVIIKETLRKTIKTPLIWILFAIVVFISFCLNVMWPIIQQAGFYHSGAPFSHYYLSSDAWISVNNQFFFIVIPLIGAFVGENCAVPNELVYLLSKPIKRSHFLIAKCIAAAIVTFVISFCVLLFLFFIAFILLVKRNGGNMFVVSNVNEKAFNLFGTLITSWLLMIILTSASNVIMRYSLRGGMSIIITVLLFGIYVALYPAMVPMNMADGDYDVIEYIWWSVCPSFLSIVIFIPVLFVFGRLFLKKEIES